MSVFPYNAENGRDRRRHLRFAVAVAVAAIVGNAPALQAQTEAAVRDTAVTVAAVPDTAALADSALNLVFDNTLELTAASLPPLPALDPLPRLKGSRGKQQSIYAYPYSLTGTTYDWHGLWVNTAVLTGAFVGTLFVLECLPEDATSWNRAALQQVPLFKRWRQHVLEKGPEWDHDKVMFNYVLHPYAGAAYFMGARSCGFNFYQSMLYSALISTVGWEFGIEAFMERPSYQDLFITPIVGSALGEGFYRLKRKIVNNGYCLFGSPVLGNIVAFLIAPLNEVIGLFRRNPAREVGRQRAWERRNPGPQLSMSLGLNSISLKLRF